MFDSLSVCLLVFRSLSLSLSLSLSPSLYLSVSPSKGRLGLPPVAGKLRTVNRFDAEFFNLNSKQAEMTDPQTRILLEVCYEAVVDAGSGWCWAVDVAGGGSDGVFAADGHVNVDVDVGGWSEGDLMLLYVKIVKIMMFMLWLVVMVNMTLMLLLVVKLIIISFLMMTVMSMLMSISPSIHLPHLPIHLLLSLSPQFCHFILIPSAL